MSRRSFRRSVWVLIGLVTGWIGFGAPDIANAQVPTGVLTIARGTSTVVNTPETVQRVSIGDPEIADAVVVSPREVLVNARALGSTTLIVWDAAGGRRFYNIEVTADAAALQRQLQTLFPGEQISVTASGNTIILSGRVSSAAVGRRALEVAAGTGATVIDNLTVPAPRQILLQVRFAEVSRTAARDFSSLLRAVNADRFDGVDSWGFETLSDGLMQLFLVGDGASFDAAIRALQTRGSFRSLAEPNLLAVEGQEASFLAGGEFPFPVPQPGQAGNLVTIVFREFGVRLRFTPWVTAAGNIRLTVAPEVSSLDFANALRFGGFEIPSLLSRKAETQIELREGQTFAIAGLMDHTLLDNASRIPVLGDLPVIGALFRTRSRRQDRTELLVLVTPRFVQPSDVPLPVPTGEPETWPWVPEMRGPAVPGAVPPATSN